MFNYHRFIRISDINEFGLLRSNDKKYASIDKSKEELAETTNKTDIITHSNQKNITSNALTLS